MIILVIDFFFKKQFKGLPSYLRILIFYNFSKLALKLMSEILFEGDKVEGCLGGVLFNTRVRILTQNPNSDKM